MVPIYIGESSPASIRGFLITQYQLLSTIGYFASSVLGGYFALNI